MYPALRAECVSLLRALRARQAIRFSLIFAQYSLSGCRADLSLVFCPNMSSGKHLFEEARE